MPHSDAVLSEAPRHIGPGYSEGDLPDGNPAARHFREVSAAPRRNRIRPLRAWRALRALGRSGGTDYRQAAAFMSATEGQSGQRAFARFQASAAGARMLRRRPMLRVMLGGDRRMLAGLPPGALGRAYHDFMAAHDFSVEGMAELGLAGGERPMGDDEKWFAERMNTLHDVRHVVAGYGQEPLGELCLLAFRYAQTRHPGMGFFAVIWAFRTAARQRGQPVIAAVMEGYRRGRDAVWMDDLEWEELLAQPLTAVRTRLSLKPPTTYDLMVATPSPCGLSA